EVKAAVPALIDFFKDTDAWGRYRAADALGNIGAEAKAAAPALIDALKDGEIGYRNRQGSEKTVSSMAVGALCKIEPEAVKKGAVPALIDALKDPDAEMHRIAVSALGQIGVTAVPALSDALKDPEASVRSGAADALDRIGDRTAAGGEGPGAAPGGAPQEPGGQGRRERRPGRARDAVSAGRGAGTD